MSDKARDYMYYICSVFMVISATTFIFDKLYSPYVFAVTSAGVAIALLTGTYKGDNLRLKRLNIQQVIAAVLLPLSSYFMFKGSNEWFMFLLISAVLQVYIIFIKDYELKKEHGENNKPTEQ